MPTPATDTAVAFRQQTLMRDTLRRFVRRGSRPAISKLLGKVRPEDVAELLDGLTPAERLEVFRVLAVDYPDAAGDVLTEIEAGPRNQLLERLGAEEVAAILARVPVDDAVYLIEDLPDELKEEVLAGAEMVRRSAVHQQLAYEEDSAGRVMTRELFSLPESTLVRQAVASIQENRDVELIFYLYIVDDEGRLVGVTSLRQLLLAPPGRTLGEIAQRDVIQVTTGTDQEEVARLAARYDLMAIPVVDEELRLVGIVTVDDIIDIVREEATEDFLKMVGTSDEEIVHEQRSFKVARIRFPWLAVNLVGALITGVMLERFQVRLSEALFLLTFVPVIMGMGGNVGSQTATLTVRGLATGRIGGASGESWVGRFLWRQTKVGVVLGVTFAALVAGGAMLMERNPWYAAVVGGAMLAAMLLAAVSGAMIPLLFERLGIDPAVAAGPLVTTANDVTGILIYFGFASLLIGHLVR
jgi:magnesium transporter